MNPKRKQRLITISLMIIAVSIAAALVLYALRQNINLFYTPTQVAEGDAPLEYNIRIGGLVKAGSILRDENSLDFSFIVTDTLNDVLVRYTGILPDLFREEQGIVVLGQLQGDYFKASQVLAKHDENYMPPEAIEALSQAKAKQLFDAD